MVGCNCTGSFIHSWLCAEMNEAETCGDNSISLKSMETNFIQQVDSRLALTTAASAAMHALCPQEYTAELLLRMFQEPPKNDDIFGPGKPCFRFLVFSFSQLFSYFVGFCPKTDVRGKQIHSVNWENKMKIN